MKPLALLGLALAAACAPAATPAPTPTPSPAPAQPAPVPTQQQPTQQPAPTPPPATPAPVAPGEAPRDWHLLDWEADRVPGIGLRRAERELLAGKQPQRTVVVAIIDSGVDTAHADLRANLWRNDGETPGNGRDDDGNGYVDDVHGWNFIGGADGRNVNEDTYEVTRLYVRCTRAPRAGSADTLPAALRSRCGEIEQAFQAKRQEAQQTLAQIATLATTYEQVQRILQPVVGGALTTANVQAVRSTDPRVQQAREIYLQFAANGLDAEELTEAREAYTSQVEYGYNPDFDPRAVVGDDYANTAQRSYGNRDVTGPDADHGTHVAGIVGAVRGDGAGMDGVASRVQLMVVRAVPDGDERDKDVANAIRYAADNGAHIINMSFGKAWSPYKPLVDEAVKYADSKGVLMIHAAGNDGEDVAKEPSFPTPVYKEGGRAANWIEVGATSWRMRDSLVAPFSNYGKGFVDVFAPGDDIYAPIPGGKFKKESGTSMASPVVSGLSALLMSYYPTLTAADVKRIVLESVTKLGDQDVIRPGEGGMRVKFGELSTTGGIVNAYNAIKLAEEITRVRP